MYMCISFWQKLSGINNSFWIQIGILVNFLFIFFVWGINANTAHLYEF